MSLIHTDNKIIRLYEDPPQSTRSQWWRSPPECLACNKYYGQLVMPPTQSLHVTSEWPPHQHWLSTRRPLSTAPSPRGPSVDGGRSCSEHFSSCALIMRYPSLYVSPNSLPSVSPPLTDSKVPSPAPSLPDALSLPPAYFFCRPHFRSLPDV